MWDQGLAQGGEVPHLQWSGCHADAGQLHGARALIEAQVPRQRLLVLLVLEVELLRLFALGQLPPGGRSALAG